MRLLSASKRLAAAVVFLLSGAVGALAEDPPRSGKPAEVPANNDTVHGYGTIDPDCLAWSNGCVICARDEKGLSHCSTPGIACIPVDVSCKVSKSK